MSTPSKDRFEAYISGRVQGVGFRHFTTKQADKLGITGWVRNENDGRVRIIAEGDRSQLESLLDAVQNGPTTARVTEVDSEWTEFQDEFDEFTVRR